LLPRDWPIQGNADGVDRTVSADPSYDSLSVHGSNPITGRGSVKRISKGHRRFTSDIWEVAMTLFRFHPEIPLLVMRQNIRDLIFRI
jgi:hypothetical protein